MVFSEHLTFLGQIFGFLNSQIYVDAFPRSGFSKKKKKKFSLAFLPSLWAVCCISAKIFSPRWLWVVHHLTVSESNAGQFSTLSEVQVRQIRDLASVSQAAPRQLRTNKHNILSIRSALLPMDQGFRLLHWGGRLPSSGTPQSWGGVWARRSKNATELSYHC